MCHRTAVLSLRQGSGDMPWAGQRHLAQVAAQEEYSHTHAPIAALWTAQDGALHACCSMGGNAVRTWQHRKEHDMRLASRQGVHSATGEGAVHARYSHIGALPTHSSMGGATTCRLLHIPRSRGCGMPQWMDTVLCKLHKWGASSMGADQSGSLWVQTRMAGVLGAVWYSAVVHFGLIRPVSGQGAWPQLDDDSVQ